MSDDPWATLVGSSGRIVGKRIAGEHFLDYYWARAHDGSLGLVLRNVEHGLIPQVLPRLRGLLLSTDTDDGALEVRMFLRDRAERNVFFALCKDVIAYSADCASQEDSVRRFFRRLGHWHSLMSRARTDSMDPHELRGLIGELVILEKLMDSSGVSCAVAAWMAPDEHPQDFALDGKLIEVKSRLSGSRNNVRVSSLEQLEPGILALYLVVVELVESEAADARSLNETVAAVVSLARDQSAELEDRLESALLKRGYVRQHQYDLQKYRAVGVCAFSVRDDFPRIARSEVDSRIIRAEYTLDLSVLSDFAVSKENILS